MLYYIGRHGNNLLGSIIQLIIRIFLAEYRALPFLRACCCCNSNSSSNLLFQQDMKMTSMPSSVLTRESLARELLQFPFSSTLQIGRSGVRCPESNCSNTFCGRSSTILARVQMKLEAHKESHYPEIFLP